MTLMTYLLKDHNGTHYFRGSIPPALRPFLPSPWTGKANFKQSLRTKGPAEAKVEASKVLSVSIIAFGHAESALPSVAFIDTASIEDDVISEMLAEDETEREDGDDRRRKAPSLVPRPAHMAVRAFSLPFLLAHLFKMPYVEIQVRGGVDASS